MAEQTNVPTNPLHMGSLGKRMLQGSAVALVLISIYLYGVDNPDPNWPKLWMLKPLIIVPVAGAMGSIFFYLMERMYQGGWMKLVAILAGVVGYIVALWLGTVVGLDGTLWD